jgi:hypothetical protein
MAFVTLHAPEGTPVKVNPAHVVAIAAAGNRRGEPISHLYLAGGPPQGLLVMGAPEGIEGTLLGAAEPREPVSTPEERARLGRSFALLDAPAPQPPRPAEKERAG